MRGAWQPAALLCLLAIPYHPFWLDYEAARRGLMLLAVGAMAVFAWRWWPATPGWAAGLLLALGAWHGVRSLGVEVPVLGLQRTAYLLALAALFCWGRRHAPDAWMRAALPVGLTVGAYGLLQGLGLTVAVRNATWDETRAVESWSSGYLWLQSFLALGGPDDPVSTLGNRNVASEVVAITGACAAALLRRPGPWRLASATLAVAMAYFVVNGSRSGLVALPIAACWVLAQGGKDARRRVILGAAMLAGLGCGVLGHLVRPAAGSADAASAAASTGAAPRPSTLAVRLEIYRSSLRLAAEHPILGHGAGQWPVAYPLVRTQREIDLSTTGAQGPRSFRATPHTAHNDHIELLVDGGAVGLALWWSAWLVVLVAAWRRHRLAVAPLLAFLATSMVRSPLGNAPAAALAFGLAGAIAAGGRNGGGTARRWLAPAAVAVAGVAAAALGLSTVAAQTVAARYQRDRELPRGDGAPVQVLTRALAWNDDDVDLHGLRLQEHLLGGATGEQVVEDLDALARLAPHDPHALFLRANGALGRSRAAAARARMEQARGRDAEVRAQLDRARRLEAEALGLLGELLAIDPRDPEATLMLATIHADAGQPAAAIAALYRDPHPRLVAELPTIFADLAQLADAADRSFDAVAYRAEGAFVGAVAALQEDPLSADATARTKAMAALFREAELPDLRPLLLLAVQAVAAGSRATAEGFGTMAEKVDTPLSAPQRRMLAGLEQSVLDIPVWQRVLAR